MKALVEGFMSRQPVAYILFGAGAAIAVAMEMLGVPALIFALGMYLPLELNTPALVGGCLAHFLGKRSEREGGERSAGIRERGVIIASGLMAGGALGGVFGAACRLIQGYSEDWIRTPFYGNEMVSQLISAALSRWLHACTSGSDPRGIRRAHERAIRRIDRQRHSGDRHDLGRRRDGAFRHGASSPIRGSATNRCRGAYTGGRSGAGSREAAAFRANTGCGCHRRLPCAGGHSGAIAGMKTAAAGFGRSARRVPGGPGAGCFEAMWDLAMEILGKGACGSL
jgi:hypothetical protein